MQVTYKEAFRQTLFSMKKDKRNSCTYCRVAGFRYTW